MAGKLAEEYPAIAHELHPTKNDNINPLTITSGSSKKIWWKCELEHEWQNTVSNRTRQHQGCPYCSGRKAWAGYNDLATLKPDLAKDWHPTKNLTLLPSQFTVGSEKKVWWQCNAGHEWETLILNRNKGTDCPYCAGNKAIIGKTDLKTLRPDLAAEWNLDRNDDSPNQFTVSSGKKVWWKCSRNHEWRTAISHRTGGTGCPVCVGLTILPGVNDLATTHPIVYASLDDTKNEDVDLIHLSRSSENIVWWKCPIGHEYEARVCSQVHNDTMRCPYCNNKKTLSGFNDLATLYPDAAAMWHPTKNLGLSPSNISPYSNTLVWWLAPCGHEWQSKVRERWLAKNICPTCYGQRKIPLIDTSLSEKFPEIAKEWDKEKNGLVTPESISYGSSFKVWWKCASGHSWITRIDSRTTTGTMCPHCVATSYCSNGEKELVFILHLLYSGEIKTTVRDAISPNELDIFIPDMKFAVEFNGVFWHSEKFKERNYHLNKMQACTNVGITLYQVWEDDWTDRRDIVIRGLAHRLGVADKLHRVLLDMPLYYAEKIGARKTKVVTLDSKTASEFLNTHHIQGAVVGSHYIGLEDRDARLRAVLVLTRTGKKGELRIDRYASAGIVSGGFTKLLSYSEKTFTPKKWITFADRAISTGGLYEDTGFHVDKVIRPDYSYLVKGKRVHKFNYRIARFKTDPNLIYEEGLTETQLAELNGLIRIWDSGKNRYVKEVK